MAGRKSILLVTLLGSLALGPGAQARLAISGNDGAQLQKGEDIGETPDSVSVIDLASYPPKVIGDVKVPASMIGPPEAVVVARDDSFAIVTAAQKYNPADPLHAADDDKVSVIDLSTPSKPKVLQTVAAGPAQAVWP
jgi:hypothetical protein